MNIALCMFCLYLLFAIVFLVNIKLDSNHNKKFQKYLKSIEVNYTFIQDFKNGKILDYTNTLVKDKKVRQIIDDKDMIKFL